MVKFISKIEIQKESTIQKVDKRIDKKHLNKKRVITAEIEIVQPRIKAGQHMQNLRKTL